MTLHGQSDSAIEVLNDAITYGPERLTDDRMMVLQTALAREDRLRKALETIERMADSPLLSDMAQDVLRRTASRAAADALAGREPS